MEQAPPLIVRFYKRTNARMFNRSVVVEKTDAASHGQTRVTFGSKSRDTGRRIKTAFGTGRITEYAGPNRNTLAIRVAGESLHELPTNREAINEYVRRIRPDDAEELARHDAAIEDARRALAAARDNRLHFLHEAFQRAHTVAVKELVAMAEQSARPE